jgi:hypothetical protein
MELLRYHSEEDPSGSFTILNVWRHGLIEFSRPIGHRTTSSGISLDVVEIGVSIVAFVNSVRDDAYKACYGLAKTPKLDWFISISQALSDPEQGWLPGGSLSFLGASQSKDQLE